MSIVAQITSILRMLRDVKIPRAKSEWNNKCEYRLSFFTYFACFQFDFVHYFLKNGGGVVYSVTYLLLLLLCGIPLLFLETSLGQFSGKGCLYIFKICPLLKGCGITILVFGLLATSHYTVIASYALRLAFEPFNQGNLSQTLINRNNSHCTQLRVLENVIKIQSIKNITFAPDEVQSAHSFVGLEWHLLLSTCFTCTLLFLCSLNGVKSIGKVAYFSTLVPLATLSLAGIHFATLSGSLQGISASVYPDWNKLLTPSTWADATTDVLFSLRIGWGANISLATFNNFQNSNKRDVIFFAVGICFIRMLAGFSLFSLLGFMAHETGLPIEDLSTSGNELAFITFPEALAKLSWSKISNFFYFLSVFLQAFGFICIQFNSLIITILDEFKTCRRSKEIVSFVCSCAILSFSWLIVNNKLDVLDGKSVTVLTISLVELFVVGWAYGIKNFARDAEFMNRQRSLYCSWWSPYQWKFITPIILMLTLFFVLNSGQQFCASDDQPRWIFLLITLAFIPFYMGYKLLYFSEGDLFERISVSLKAGEKWYPREFKEEWLLMVYKKRVFKMRHIVRSKSDTSLHKKFVALTSENVEC